VQLEVVVAVVNRSEARNMSFSWANNNGNGWFISSVFNGPFAFTNSLATAPGATTSALSQTGQANIPFGILNSHNSFMGFLQALNTEGLSKILSEPRVVTLSGTPAYFVSGGQVPILTSGGTGTPTVDYKDFGTLIQCKPIVLGNGKIQLDIKAEISDVDQSLALNIAGVTPTSIPGFRKRSTQVTIQVGDGQTLAIGGLIQNNVDATISRVPVLGNLPFLGVAFTSKTYKEVEQEMIILVTPRLVDPVSCDKIPKYLPGRETRVPSDFELFLEGIMEAPRGQRNVNLHPHQYKAAHMSAENIGQIPCGDGSCYRGGSGCANGNCGTSYSGAPITQVGSRAPSGMGMPTPGFPELQAIPTSNPRAEQDLPPSYRDLPPGFGPVTPTTPTLPYRQPDARPTLPPVTVGPTGR
jgi:pilus assembly protein CpaC